MLHRKYSPLDTMVGTVAQRRCVYCGKMLPLHSCFNKHGKDKDGNTLYRNDCKVCYNLRRRETTGKSKYRVKQFVAKSIERGDTAAQSYTEKDWLETLIYFEGKCAYCGAVPAKGKSLHKDHIVPMALGGKTTKTNIIPACKACNSSKGKRELVDWATEQTFFSRNRLHKIKVWMKGGE